MALTKEDIKEIKKIVENSEEQTRRYLWMKIWSVKEIIIDEIKGKKNLPTSKASRELHKLIDKMQTRLNEDIWKTTREYLECKIKSRES